MAFLLIAPNLPAIQQSFASEPNIAVLAPVALTIPALMIAIFSAPAGFLSDRLGRRQVLIGSLVVYLIAGIAPAFLNSIGEIIFARAVVGLAEAAIVTCSTTLIGDYYAVPTRNKYVSLQAASTSIASVLFLVIGGALGELGWRATFCVYALCLVLIPAVVVVVWNPEATRHLSGASSRGAVEAGGFPWLTMIAMWIFTAFAAIVFFIVPIQTANLLTGIGLDQPALIGLATAIGAVNLAVGGASYAKLAGVRPGFALAVSFALIAAGLILMAKAQTLLVFILGIIPTGLGSGFVIPALLNWTLLRLSLPHRARGVGAWYGTFFLGQFVSPLVILAVAGAVGGLPTALADISVVCVASAIGCVFWGLMTGPVPTDKLAPL
jgi:MFS family permease